MNSIRRLQIRSDAFAKCPELRTPLNDALIQVQDVISQVVDGLVRLVVLPPADILVTSNTPGTAPWPLRLAQVVGSPLGVTILRVENLTTAGSTGVPTTAVTITSQRVDGQTVFVDFISGLTLSSRYRIVFGVYDASS